MTEPVRKRDWVGVCVVRAERESAQLRITVSSTPDITTDETSREVFRRPDAALAAVAEFLRLFSD